MFITLHDVDGDCFHINTDKVIMISPMRHLEETESGIDLVPTEGKYAFWLDGLDIPVIFPERAVADFMTAVKDMDNPHPMFGRN
jgi:hypothetical protein